MIKALLSAAILFGAGVSFAGELDNEGSVTNHGLQGTVVLRIDNRTGAASMVESKLTPKNEKEAQLLAQKASFKKVPAGKMRTELDNDGGASSWYWYGGVYAGYGGGYAYGYAYSYNYYGNYYNPCYSYNYGYYNYYYYNPYMRWW